MKKLISIFLILAMLLSFASCGGASKPLVAEEQEEIIETEKKSLDVRIKTTGKEYVPGDTIFQDGFENYNNYSIMVDGHLYKAFEVSIDDEKIVEFKNNGAGVISATNLSFGTTKFSLKIDGQSFDYIWTNDFEVAEKNNQENQNPENDQKNNPEGTQVAKENQNNTHIETATVAEQTQEPEFNSPQFESPQYKEEFKAFLNTINNNRLSVIRPKYNPDNEYNAAKARKDLKVDITKQELDSIKYTGWEYVPKTISYDEACQDVSLLFRSMKYGYAAYCYFGADNFEKAEVYVMQQMEGRDTINTEELANMLYESMKFVRDSHFNILHKTYCNEPEARYEYYYSSLCFGKDAMGYYLLKNNEKWYYKSCGNSNAKMQPYLNDDGVITYSLCQFCPITVAHKKDNVILANNGIEETVEIVWTLSEAYRKTDFLDYKLLKENGIAYVSIRSLDEGKYKQQLNTFAANGAKIKDAKLIIYDLRANSGGNDDYSSQWVKAFSGVNPKRSFVRVRWHNYLWKEINSKSFGEEEWSSSKEEAKVINNNIPIIVLVDDETGSSGEGALLFARNLNNCLVIGSNTSGYQLGANVLDFTLPNSKIVYAFCQGMNIPLDGKSVDGIGYTPDIWCNPKTALDAVINMLLNYNLADADSIKNLYMQIGHK